MTENNISHAIEYFKAKLDIIDVRLKGIEETQDEFKKRFLILDARQHLIKFVIANWWKLAAVILPTLFFLGEIGFHIRELI